MLGLSIKRNIRLAVLAAVMLFSWTGTAQAEELLKPFVLAGIKKGDMAEEAEKAKSALGAAGFKVLGSYSPYEGATVICATSDALMDAAAKVDKGGFGAVLRVALTQGEDGVQLSYVNPVYMGIAYGLGDLGGVADALKTALGAEGEFGSKGVKKKKLRRGKYHYMFGMPYFDDVVELVTYKDYETGVAAAEKNLAAGKGGTRKVYRLDLPGKEVTVFGVAIPKGDGPDKGAKDTDKEIMDIIDFQKVRSTAYLPYEFMIVGNKAIALHGRYRIALHFPDTKMMGEHGFTKIMSSPGGIAKALRAAAGGKEESES